MTPKTDEDHRLFLVELAERARRLTEPEQVIADAVRSVGQFLGVGRCVFGDIDLVADTCTIVADYCADESVASIVGVFPFSEFGPFVVAEYQAGRGVAVEDVRLDPVRVPEANVVAYEDIGIRAHVTVPVVHSARLVSVLAVHSATPRHWEPEEVALLQTVVERTWLTVEVLRQQRALAREAEITARILERIADAFFALDAEWRFTYVNDQAERVLSRAREELLGKSVWDTFPDAVGSTFDRQYRRAVAEGIPVSFEEFYPPLDAWLEVRAYPSPDGLSVFFQNVNDRKQNETYLQERTRLASLAAAVGHALTTRHALPDILTGCTDALVEHLDAAFARVWTLDAGEDVLVLRASSGLYTHLDGPHGRVPVGQFKIGLIAQERLPHLTNAVVGDPRVGDQEWAVREGMVAFAGYPLIVEDRLVGVIALFARHALSDVTLQALGSVSDQIAVGIERKSAEEAAQEANRRTETILESITDASYAVDAQMRFTYVNRQAEALWGRARGEFLGRPLMTMLPRMAGSFSLAQHERALTERVPMHYETISPVLGRWVEVSIYPTADGGLSVFFRDVSERKALEAERAELAERERKIASQLQEALTPTIPDHVPGLRLAKYYEAALDEAGVGGDFYDVFPIEKGCTVLAVGDLSGKGLAAAVQVSTVRNMLRAFLYSKPTLAEAVTDLNRVLALNGLLTGFATLWVGCYDGSTSELAYVNLGQEPALLRRAATGEIEQLPPTGPVLGAVENASYEERTVTLSPGDALAIFTDGATECGITRRQMLGIEGVAALLGPPLAPEEAVDAERAAEAVALRLVEGVDAASRGGVAKDDVCILVAVAGGAAHRNTGAE